MGAEREEKGGRKQEKREGECCCVSSSFSPELLYFSFSLSRTTPYFLFCFAGWGREKGKRKENVSLRYLWGGGATCTERAFCVFVLFQKGKRKQQEKKSLCSFLLSNIFFLFLFFF